MSELASDVSHMEKWTRQRRDDWADGYEFARREIWQELNFTAAAVELATQPFLDIPRVVLAALEGVGE